MRATLRYDYDDIRELSLNTVSPMRNKSAKRTPAKIIFSPPELWVSMVNAYWAEGYTSPCFGVLLRGRSGDFLF